MNAISNGSTIRLSGTGLILVLVLALSACATDQPHRALAGNMIQAAETRADHEAIAHHYDQEADAFLAKADQMRRHLAGYERQKGRMIMRQRETFIQHCKSLIGNYESNAQENRELAKLHRQIAAELN